MSDADSLEALLKRVEELEATVEELGDTVATATNRDLPLLKATVRAMSEEDIESLDELPDLGRTLNDRLGTYNDRIAVVERQLEALGDIGSNATSKDEKFATVLAFAMNKGSGCQKVAVSPAEIKGCTGVSRRYAYDLIEVIADEIDGVQLREPTQVETGSGTKRKAKALLVDCERVPGDCDGVNQFTTGEEVSGEP